MHLCTPGPNHYARPALITERGIPGEYGYKETVDFGEYIGIWKDHEGIASIPTTRGTIHYGKKGAHIVPARPINTNK